MKLARQFQQWWGEAWRGDPFASDLAMQGEHRVARSRFVVVGALALVNATVLVLDPGNRDFADALLVNVAGLAGALVILLATRRGSRSNLLQTVTVFGDVTAVTLLHVVDLLKHQPSVAINGRVSWSLYFIAMVGTCMRFNPWLAVFGGVVAAAEYGGLALWGIAIWPSTVTPDILHHGTYDWGVQLERVVTLLIFGGICASIAAWAMQLRSSATHDMLTGLLNRRTFEEQLHTELLRAQRSHEPLAVAMIDVDHFKRVNDTFGHHAGDLVLREIAALLRETVRRTDLAGRWGGEEFALLFPSESLESAGRHLERLRSRLEASPFTLPQGELLRLTISAGLALAPRDGQDALQLVRVADTRLLDAKRSGRNRVVTGTAAELLTAV